MSKRLIISEEEKNYILNQHSKKDIPKNDKELTESEEDYIFEPSPRGMRSARSRADYEPAGKRELEIGSEVFGKYSEEIPPIVIRYMRKNPRAIIKRLYRLYGEKMLDYIEDVRNK